MQNMHSERMAVLPFEFLLYNKRRKPFQTGAIVFNGVQSKGS